VSRGLGWRGRGRGVRVGGGTPTQTTMVKSGNSGMNKIPPHNVRTKDVQRVGSFVKGLLRVLGCDLGCIQSGRHCCPGPTITPLGFEQSRIWILA
jgi:hypothetical protein